MSAWGEAAGNWLRALGIRPLRSLRLLSRVPALLARRARLARALAGDAGWPMTASRPCLDDDSGEGGVASGHYFHQDLQVARWVLERAPGRHVDVGSRVDGFVAHLAVFRVVEYYDLRPVGHEVRNIVFQQGDLSSGLGLPRGECESVSCLHVMEHVGLGRYGDAIDADGWIRALDNLVAMLRPGGRLYLGAPVGRQRVEYNAHRVFAPRTLLDAAAERGLAVAAHAWVDDEGRLVCPGVTLAEACEVAARWRYGCGIFEFVLAASGAEGGRRE